jgi:hypothetical protein
MQKNFFYNFLAFLVLIVSFSASAQTSDQSLQPVGPPDLIIKVSTLQGTYAKFFEQISKVCTKPSLQMSTSAGTVAALTDILNNSANVAFMTADVLYGRKLIEGDNSVDNLRVLMPLYTSELHIIAARSNGDVNKFSDLGNKRVATYGGAYITARITLAQANIRPISLQDYQTEAAAINAVKTNQADVAMIGAGQPTTWAKELSGNDFKLLDFDRQDLLGRNGYVSAGLRYPNLSSTVTRSLGVKVYLITYNYESEKKIQDLSSLKQCIVTHIGDLKETTGNHPKWREVNPNAKTDWEMFKTSTTTTPKSRRQSKQ